MDRIVDDNEISSSSCHSPADAGGEIFASIISLPPSGSLAIRRKTNS
jgi:hypothetical protein